MAAHDRKTQSLNSASLFILAVLIHVNALFSGSHAPGPVQTFDERRLFLFLAGSNNGSERVSLC